MIFGLTMAVIKKGYPRLRSRFGKLTGYIALVRPFTLLSPLLAGILGVLATTSFSMEKLMVAIYVGVTLASCQAAGQVINQYADASLDKLVKQYRPIPSGLISKEEALGVGWLLALFSVARAFTITISFGLLTVLLLFFAVFYSLSPLSPRRIHPVLNIFWMAISRGFIPVMAVWSIYGHWVSALPYAWIAFVWVLGFQGTKDLEDVEADKQFGIKTLPGEFGSFGLVMWMVACTFILVCSIFLTQLLIMFALVPLAIFSIWGFNRKSKFTENTYGWLGFYAGLGVFFILLFSNQFFLKS